MAKSLKKRVKALEKRLQEIDRRLEAGEAADKGKRSRVIALHKKSPKKAIPAKAPIARPDLRHPVQTPSGISGAPPSPVSGHA